MRQRHEMEELRERAYRAQGWLEGSGKPRLARAALSEEERRQRDFAEGVEAGLLFALTQSGDPFGAEPSV